MEVRWEWMFIDQLEQRFQECPLAYLPYEGPINLNM
ncbi:hypothetical protein FHS15_003857 [Paenibacillus castaneae]|nr:hypothetical protein [Paenibacillus castaneae]